MDTRLASLDSPQPLSLPSLQSLERILNLLFKTKSLPIKLSRGGAVEPVRVLRLMPQSEVSRLTIRICFESLTD